MLSWYTEDLALCLLAYCWINRTRLAGWRLHYFEWIKQTGLKATINTLWSGESRTELLASLERKTLEYGKQYQIPDSNGKISPHTCTTTPTLVRVGSVLFSHTPFTQTKPFTAELLLRARELKELNPPSTRDYTSVLNFMELDGGQLYERESEFIYHKEDLVTLKPGREYAWLDGCVERILQKCRCRLLRVYSTTILARWRVLNDATVYFCLQSWYWTLEFSPVCWHLERKREQKLMTRMYITTVAIASDIVWLWSSLSWSWYSSWSPSIFSITLRSKGSLPQAQRR